MVQTTEQNMGRSEDRGPVLNDYVTKDGVLIVHCRVRLLDLEDVIDRWGEDLIRTAGDHPDLPVVINFSEVNMLTSSGFRALVVLHYQLEERGLRLALCHLKPDIRLVFKMTCLDSLFLITEDEDSACRALAHGQDQSNSPAPTP